MLEKTNKKNNQSELENTITEMKNTLEGINSRLGDTEECINDLEGRIMKITQSEKQKGGKENNLGLINDDQDNFC